jgi:hypothetical protein
MTQEKVVAECWSLTCMEPGCDCKGDGSRMIDDLSGEPCEHPAIPCPLTADQADDCRALGHDVRPMQKVVAECWTCAGYKADATGHFAAFAPVKLYTQEAVLLHDCHDVRPVEHLARGCEVGETGKAEGVS